MPVVEFGVGPILMLACAATHYSALLLLNDYLPGLTLLPRKALVFVAIVGAMLSHAVHVCLFAVAYSLLTQHLAGDLVGDGGSRTLSEFLYFSAETYTSLGLGDIYPRGGLRLLVGIESITGLLMIGWTTSFTYLEMRRYWRDPTATVRR
jgi:hypothetical protein